MIEIPEQFARDTLQREGESGRRWVESLPQLIEQYLQRWDLHIDGPVMHGYIGVVLPVIHQDQLCALKISWVDHHSLDEAAALRAWNGAGAVRVIRAEPEAGAMLMERLDLLRSLSKVKIEE